MIRWPSASSAMDTEVRMLRSSSTSAMTGMGLLSLGAAGGPETGGLWSSVAISTYRAGSKCDRLPADARLETVFPVPGDAAQTAQSGSVGRDQHSAAIAAVGTRTLIFVEPMRLHLRFINRERSLI